MALAPRRARLNALAVCIALLASLLGPPLAARAQQATTTIKDTVYVSPHWGFSVRWHDDDWILDLDLAFEDSDTLGLRDAAGNYLLFTGERGFAGDADACLDQMIVNAGETPGPDLAVALDSAGARYESRGPEQAYVVYQTTAADADGNPQDLVVYAECQTLVPGEAVLKRQYSGTPATFMQSYDAIVDVLESVHHPWGSAWLPEDPATPFVWTGYSPLRGYDRDTANLFPFPDGDVPATLLIDLVDQAGSTRVITFRNVSDAPVTVEPQNLSLTLSSLFDEADPIIETAASATWEDGVNPNPDGSRTLSPGESATIHVAIAPIDPTRMSCDVLPLLLFAYRDSAGGSTEFGASDLSACLFDEPDDPRPVLAAPLPVGVAVESLMAPTAGERDDLGRIPFARISLEPGASAPDTLFAGPLSAVVESGTVELTLGETVVTVPTGQLLSAEPGTFLTVRNPTDTPASLLALPEETRDDWGIPLAEFPPPGVAFTLLIPYQELMQRQAPGFFSLDRITLDPGAAYAPAASDASPLDAIAILVESGAVSTTDPFFTDPLIAGDNAILPPDTILQATSDGPATLLLVRVTGDG